MPHSNHESSLTTQFNEPSAKGDEGEDRAGDRDSGYGFRFWAVFAALVLTALISALDGSIVSTALPTIVRDLDAGENYIWVVNVYFLTR